jgi:superoxide reductase
MKILECKVCGHIEFNEVVGKCKVCRNAAEMFAENPDAIRRPADPNNLTDGDRKHIPQIFVRKDCALIVGGPCTDVMAKVGEIEHVMQSAHYIRTLDFYLDHQFISRIWLSPETCHAAAGLHLSASSGTLTVLENCNVHGNWMAEVEL